jgi:hypothetical protein
VLQIEVARAALDSLARNRPAAKYVMGPYGNPLTIADLPGSGTRLSVTKPKWSPPSEAASCRSRKRANAIG